MKLTWRVVQVYETSSRYTAQTPVAVFEISRVSKRYWEWRGWRKDGTYSAAGKEKTLGKAKRAAARYAEQSRKLGGSDVLNA